MKSFFCIALAVTALTLTNTMPVHAFRGGYGGHYSHGDHVGVDVVIGPGWGPYYPYYAYYPYVKKCPQGWLKVVCPSPPEDQGV